MGGGSWSSRTWGNYATQHVAGKSQSQIFASRLDEAVDPLKFTNGIRESVDSVDNPNSTPVAIFTDMTGSMGILAETVVRKLDTVCKELLARKPVPDVHLLTGTIGDAYSDHEAPFQATQFEADIRIAEQTQKLYLTKNGGGNGGESYALAWLFAALQTATDSYDKRRKKGYLFTVGDEPVHGVPGGSGREFGVTKDQAKQWLGLDIERDLTAEECLKMAERRWNVFHLVIRQRGGWSNYDAGIQDTFGKIMPDRLLYLEDVSALPETIVSAIEVNEGRDMTAVVDSWGDGKSLVIANALKSLATRDAGGSEVVRL